jgi:hypothetical protein
MPRVRNIQFEREQGAVLIVGDDAVVYFPVERVRKRLLTMSARDLARVLGAELLGAEGTICTGLRVGPEPQPATGDDEPETGDESGAPAVDPNALLDAVRRKVEDRRRTTPPVIEKYGAAVRQQYNEDTGKVELWLYPVTRSGALSPVGTKVTQPTQPFLDEVNKVLGTSYYVAQFLPPVDDGMPF